MGYTPHGKGPLLGLKSRQKHAWLREKGTARMGGLRPSQRPAPGSRQSNNIFSLGNRICGHGGLYTATRTPAFVGHQDHPEQRKLNDSFLPTIGVSAQTSLGGTFRPFAEHPPLLCHLRLVA
jgi:hypothetical protein